MAADKNKELELLAGNLEAVRDDLRAAKSLPEAAGLGGVLDEITEHVGMCARAVWLLLDDRLAGSGPAEVHHLKPRLRPGGDDGA